MKIIAILFAFTTSVVLYAQQPAQYATTVLDPFRINPAYAGLDFGISANGVYRQQWAGLEGAPSGQRINIHSPLYFLRSGVGLQIENDEIGAHRLSQVGLAWNYQLETGSGHLSAGLGATIQQWTLQGGALRTPDGNYQEPGNFTHNDNLLTLADDAGSGLQFSAGIFYRASSWQAGVSVENLSMTSISFSQLTYSTNRVYHAYASSEWEVGSNLRLRPALWFRTDAVAQQLDLSLMATFKDNIYAGTSFRGYSGNTQDAVVLMAGVQLSPSLRLIYAHDFGISALQSVHNGSHEIMISYFLNKAIGTGKPPRIIYHPRAKGQ
ncbi:MAG: PorP/SprF family type IX secretion system membrane protein [Saprospiraceae bacterium]